MTFRKAVIYSMIASCCLWIFYNGHLLKNRVWIIFDEKTIYENLYLGGAYYNAGTYTFIVAGLAILLTEYCLKREHAARIIRFSGRDSYFLKRTAAAAITDLVYMGIYMTIGLIFSLMIFQCSYVLNLRTLLFYAGSLISGTMYLIRTSIVYLLIRDILKRKLLAVILCVFLGILEFFAAFYIFQSYWFPCKDLWLGTAMYQGAAGTVGVIVTMIRQICITLVVFEAGRRMFLHKDVIENEE